MTVGMLIVTIIAAVVAASFAVGWLWLRSDYVDGWGSAYWLGFATILTVVGVVGIVVLLVHVIVAFWGVPL